MLARAFGAFGLGLVTVLTACGGGGGGTSGGAATASAAPTAAAATATAVPKATCAAKKITIAVPVTPPNVVHLTPYVADAFGYFKDENLTVELVRFDGGVTDRIRSPSRFGSWDQHLGDEGDVLRVA